MHSSWCPPVLLRSVLPPLSLVPRCSFAPPLALVHRPIRPMAIHPSSPLVSAETPSIQTVPGYSRDNEKALSLRTFGGTCGIRAGALCQPAIISPAETSERRRRRLDPEFFVPRALEISLARHYVNNEYSSPNGPADWFRSDLREAPDTGANLAVRKGGSIKGGGLERGFFFFNCASRTRAIN